VGHQVRQTLDFSLRDGLAANVDDAGNSAHD
jgi:hypothetical protein